MPSLIGLTVPGIPRPRVRATSRGGTDPLPGFDAARHLLAANASALDVANSRTRPQLLLGQQQRSPWVIARLLRSNSGSLAIVD
jgi:hypothetical protein